MFLNDKQAVDIAVGFVSYEKTDGGIVFHTVPKECEDYWFSVSESLGGRALTTTGVRLDFHTDSAYIALDITGGDKFDLLVDGLIYNKFTESGRVELPCGEKRVTVVYPSHAVGVLKSVELSDGASVSRHKFDTKILFLGDSITQGWHSEYDSLSYAWLVTLEKNAESVINGIGGSYFAAGSLYDCGFSADTIVVAYGANDYGHYKTMEDLTAACEDYFKRLREVYPETRVVYVSPIFRHDLERVHPFDDFDAVREFASKTAEKYGCEVVCGYSLVPHNMDFFADPLHPNDLGFAEYARHLVKRI